MADARLDPIETERLLLALPRTQDAAAIARYYDENTAHLAPWEPLRPPGYTTEAFWRLRIDEIRAEAAAGRALRFYVQGREAPGVVIGNVSLTQVHGGPLQAAVLGYSLAESAQGHGYMSEAVRAALRRGFEALNLHRVEANYMPHNRRSGAVLRRLGFTVEGYARDYLLIAGRWEDHIMTSLVNPDWRPQT